MFLTNEEDVSDELQHGADSDDDDVSVMGNLFNSENEVELSGSEYDDNDSRSENIETIVELSDADIEDNAEDGEEYDELDEFSDKINNPRSLPNVGDRISYWDPNRAMIISATVTPMAGTMKRKYPGWRNIVKDGEVEERSVNLDMVGHNCVAWKHSEETVQEPDSDEDRQAAADHEEPQEVDEEEQPAAALQQMDGGIITPDSLSPVAAVDQTLGNDASLDWDDYASDPTFVSTPSWSPNRCNHSSTREDFVDVLNISTDSTGSDVFPPPPLPWKARSATSVLQCSSKTCKPAHLRPPQ